MTAADQIVSDLLSSEVATFELLVTLEHENSILRTMVREALSQLARQTAHLESARTTIVGLRSELRHLARVRPAA
jgi:peptidoglycan/xylan/chitin deacetylase (PgdA/CDA1 family)